MLSTVLFSIALFGTASAVAKPAATSWEPVFQGEKGPEGWVSAVVATARDDFFVSGGWGITRSTSGRLERRDTPGHAIFGLVDANPDGSASAGEQPDGVFAGTLGKASVVACFSASATTYYYAKRGKDIGLVRRRDGAWVETRGDAAEAEEEDAAGGSAGGGKAADAPGWTGTWRLTSLRRPSFARSSGSSSFAATHRSPRGCTRSPSRSR